MAPSAEASEGEDSVANDWIKVTSKKGRKKYQVWVPAFKPIPGQLKPDLVDQICADHERITNTWRASKCCQDIRDLIATQCSSRPAITRAVCLGLGSFDEEIGFGAKRAIHVQLAAFDVIVEALSKIAGQRIPCVFQEPRFSASDKAAMERLGHKVVEDPTAFAMIDSSTLVYGIHLYYQVWHMAMEREYPGIIIGNEFSHWADYDPEEKAEAPPGYWDIIDKAESMFDKMPFPQDEDYALFFATVAYFTPNRPIEVLPADDKDSETPSDT